MVKPLRLAILHDPEEAEPPSTPETLAYLIKVAAKMDVEAKLQTLKTLRLGDTDAVFIRQTTYPNSPIHALAERVASIGIPIIDDPDSITACCDKIVMAERFAKAGVATPMSGYLNPEWNLPEAGEQLGYPFVIKDPASCFSRGVLLVESPKHIDEITVKMRAITTGPILVQEFVQSSFDWRVGILNGQILYCCQYKMAKNHWQIIKRHANGGQEEGGSITLRHENYPRDVCQLALQAAACVGKGLYGVDIKIGKEGPLVIEINDNPSIERGYEDCYGVWPKIIDRFKEMIHGRKIRQSKNASRHILQLWGHYLNADC